MLLVGTVKRLSFELRDLAGILADGTVTMSVVKPDGTTLTPAPTVENDGTGLYHVDLTLDQAGRWTWVLNSTGAVVVAEAGVLDVASTSLTNIISLEAAKEQLNIEDSDHDAELETFIAAATGVVEHFTGPIGRRSVTERHDVRGVSLVLDHADVIEITSMTAVTSWSIPVSVADLYASDAGVVRRTDGGVVGDGVYDVVYVAGRTDVPAAVGLACRVILAHLWQTQRGGGRSARGGSDTTNMMGYAIPNRAIELLTTSPSKTGAGV